MTGPILNGRSMDDYPLTLTSIVERAVRFHADREVVSRRPSGACTRTTLGACAGRARRLAGALSLLGVAEGDRVATLLWNQAEHLELYFAVPAMGAVIHTLNPRLFPDELAYIVNDAADTVIVVDESLLDILETFSAGCDFAHIIIVTHTHEAPAGMLDYESLGDVVLILAYTGLRFGELTGLNVEDVDLGARRIRVRRSITQVGGKLVEGNPKSEVGRRSVPIPERLMPALKARLDTCPPGAPAIASPKGSRLSLENWKRAVNWRKSVIEIGRAELRVHDLRHTYASLSRRAGADLRLLQKAMGHASITVTAHTYADLFDDELDDIATALDSLDDSFHVGGS